MRTVTIALICATIAFGSIVLGTGAEGGSSAPGHFQIVAQANTGSVWVLNTQSGQVRLCLPPLEDGERPECLQWGD